MTVVFISDCHFSDNSPEMIHLFCQFLDDCSEKAESLYILGDFFEVWIGDDDREKTNQLLINTLRQASEKGLPVYFMHGNRDFLIGRQFFKKTGCRPLPDEHIVNLYGNPTLLMHGDTLCTDDKEYLKFRRWSRCWLIKKLFLMKSIQSRQTIATRYRTMSSDRTSLLAPEIMDVTLETVKKQMLKHKVLTLIHGHTHKPAIHAFSLHNQPAKRIVLPAWHQTGGALLCQPTGAHKLVTFKPDHYISPFQ